ncbi:class I SAM-dependent methyltransferase [Tardiphaga sp. 803_E3_N1_3]|uniref:class I SAM-dependent methyltransferase n=1 Tax=Tardiphaga sp. 803_E3_N1_3 TaxID=3240785 RepID=UPI003F2969E9
MGWLTEKLRRGRLRAAALLQDRAVADETNTRDRRALVADFTRFLLGGAEGKDVEVRLANALINRIALEGNGATRVQELLPAWQRLATPDQSPESGDVLRLAARHLLVDQLPPDAWGLVPELARRAAPVMSTWTYQNEVMEFDIQEGDLVLDVGSGGWPFRRADHLADKFPDHTTHRMEAMVRDGRTFFEVDIENLPFKDKEYDFVFCSHVMEHLDNPGQAMRELMRVAKRGYLEVPTRLSDVMFNFTRLKDHHRWHSVKQGKTLLLTEWNERERRELGNEFFSALHSEYSNQFQSFFERNRDLFFTSYHWTDRIEFLVIDKDGGIYDTSER